LTPHDLTLTLIIELWFHRHGRSVRYRRMLRTAWPMRWSFSTSAKRTCSSP